MVKLQEAKGRYSVSIPKLMVKKKQWNKGQELFLQFNENGEIVIQEILKLV